MQLLGWLAEFCTEGAVPVPQVQAPCENEWYERRLRKMISVFFMVGEVKVISNITKNNFELPLGS